MAAVDAGYWKVLEARPKEAGAAKVICLANQKGGVGKTTTAVNVGAALALSGHRVIVVDVDPQANATTGLGLDHRIAARSTYDLLLEEAGLDDVAVPTGIEGLDCVPGSPDLAGAEVELVVADGRERKLAAAIEAARSHYDFVFLDCPPSLGLLTVNALAAADDLIVPVQCEYYALEGLGQLLGTADRIRRTLNPALRISGFVLTMYDARTKLAGQVADDIRAHFPDLAFETVIPRSVRLSEAPSFGEPVVTLDPSSRGARAYRRLAEELEARYRPPAPPPPAPVPGPAGRGYGTVAPEPPHLEDTWPRSAPWQ